MDITPNGTAHVTCHALLGVPRVVSHASNIVLYDCLLFSGAAGGNRPVIPCLLEYYNRAPMDPLVGGMYRVFIKACPSIRDHCSR